MLKNFLKSAFRQMRKDKLSTLINTIGLAVSMASVMVISGFVWYELGYDGQFADSENIYRLTFDETVARDDGRHLATVSPPFAPELKRRYPEVAQVVRVRYTDEVLIVNANKRFYENGLVYADSTFFALFPFPLAQGDPNTALGLPNSVVITAAIASKYFGKADPLGKTLLLDGERPLTVTGLLAESPQQTHLDFSMLVSFSTFVVPPGYPVTLESWGWISFHTYVKLHKGISSTELEAKFPSFLAEHFSAERVSKSKLRLQPLTDIYFESSALMNTDKNRNGNRSYLYALSLIAILLLAISVFNSLNLATARSVKRGMETSMRKVLGATRGQLMRQFVSENILQCLLSLAIGLLLFNCLKNIVGDQIGWQFEMDKAEYIWWLLAFVGLAVLLGVLAGFYPALLLSRFQPAKVLKGNLPNSVSSGTHLRKALLVMQFVITGGLVICSLVVSQQMFFLQNKQPGYNREQVIALQLQSPDFLAYFEKAKQVFGENPKVLGLTAGDVLDGDYGSMPMLLPQTERENAPPMHILGVGHGYFKTLGIAMAEGREFSENFPTDLTSGIILNEAAVRTFGLENPIGQRLDVDNLKSGAVVGVVKDFHFHSFHDPIMPLVVFMPETQMSHLLLRVQPDDVPGTIASLQQDWVRIAPDIPFQYAFLDDAIQQQYTNDRRFSALIYFFTVLTLCVACLGLYGLMVIIVNARVKEIGIRKVLGATTAGIVGLLSKDFLSLVIVSLVIASPLAYFFMEKWLQDFAYRIDIEWWVFALAAALAIAIAFVTILSQCLKSALSNPVNALKSE